MSNVLHIALHSAFLGTHVAHVAKVQTMPDRQAHVTAVQAVLNRITYMQQLGQRSKVCSCGQSVAILCDGASFAKALEQHVQCLVPKQWHHFRPEQVQNIIMQRSKLPTHVVQGRHNIHCLFATKRMQRTCVVGHVFCSAFVGGECTMQPITVGC